MLITAAGDYSTVIVHYGDPALTLECLRSAAGADLAPQESIVVWNGPAAPSDALPHGARLLDPGENLGYAGGANLGIRAALAGGEAAVLLLNNDSVIESSAPRALLDVLAADARVGIAGPRIYDARGETIWHDGGSIAWPEGRPISARAGVRAGAGAPREPFDVEFVCGCAPLIRGSAFRAAGGFDERYFFCFEDADFCMRLRAAGWRAMHVPAAAARHRGGAASGDRTPIARYYRLRNRLLFAREHAPDPARSRRACARLRCRARLRALRWRITGRGAEARAVFAALRDAKYERYGRWDGGGA